MASSPASNSSMETEDVDTQPPREQQAQAGAGDDESLPRSRLMITKLVLENFKSYGGTQEIDDFHHCFSAIVGPNGSGKSNVIDALLFVFGKRAKQLRLNKVSELIHNGSSSKSNRPTHAKVSVYFQDIIDKEEDADGDGENNADDKPSFTVVPNSAHVLSRVARHDNTSVYQLDGKTCPFRTVATFLETKGLDLENNRFLILQGEVEMISMMPPKGKTAQDTGLLEYLEEIIGSSKFVADTEAANEAIEKLGAVRQEKLQRCKATQQELDSLSGAKQEAMALLHVQREIQRKHNIVYQIQLHQAKQHQDETKQSHDELQEQLQTRFNAMKQHNERLAELSSGMAQQQAEHDTVHQELVRTKEQFAAYERRDIKLKEEIKHLQALQQKTAKKVSAEEKKHASAVEKVQAAQESIPAFEKQVDALTDKKAAEDAKLDEIYSQRQDATIGLRTQLEQKTHELAPVQQELASFQNDYDTAATQVSLLKNATVRAQERLQNAQSELETLSDQKQASAEAFEEAQRDLDESRRKLTMAVQQDQALAQEEGTLASQNKQLLARAAEAKASLQSKGDGRSSAVNAILKAARPGGELAKVGVLGRLGDLATIPEEYDVAVSTACSMLNHIVVQTTAGAQKCLAFLRKHNLGRANFCPLDKMKKGAHDRIVETPEGAPRLFELISAVNFSVTPAIYLSVGNTLVAPDLETATRWAYEYGSTRWRVVTVDGKLIETSGTMAGGGKSVRRGGMKLANARSNSSSTSMQADEEFKDCSRLEQEAAQAQQLLQECRKRRKEVTEEIRTLTKSVKALEIKLPKLEMELKGFDTTRAELTKLIPGLQAQCQLSNSDAAKLVELNAKVEKCKADMSSCEKLASTLEAEVAELQKAILDAGGPELKKQQKACDNVLAELNKTQKELNSAKVAITANEKAAAKALEVKAAAEQQLEDCKENMEEKKTERKTLEEDALKVMQSYEQVKEKEAEKRKALDAVTKECEDLQQSLSEEKVVEVELAGKLEACEKQLSDCEKKIKHWSSAIDKLRADAEEDDMELDDDEEEEGENVSSSSGSKGDDDENSNSSSDTEMKDADDDDAPVEPQGQKSALPTFSAATLAKYSKEELQNEISILETERNTIAKNANMGAIAEYRKKEADNLARVTELDAVTEERNAARKTYDDLRRMRLEMFMDGFGQITLKLKEMYQMITLGGDAELELVDSLDPFSEGIVFSVRPPKKSWKNISNLSGGEKTLSSLALVFALHHFKPTPLYVMDEIDAALDFKNVSIVANYIKDRTKNAQFVIVSLRNNMFELADRLVGIYKTNNITKSVTIDPASFGVSSQQNGVVPTTPALLENTNKKNIGTSSAVKSKDSVRRRVSFQAEPSSQTLES